MQIMNMTGHVLFRYLLGVKLTWDHAHKTRSWYLLGVAREYLDCKTVVYFAYVRHTSVRASARSSNGSRKVSECKIRPLRELDAKITDCRLSIYRIRSNFSWSQQREIPPLVELGLYLSASCHQIFITPHQR